MVGKGDAVMGRDAEFERWLRAVMANLQEAVLSRPLLAHHSGCLHTFAFLCTTTWILKLLALHRRAAVQACARCRLACGQRVS